MTLPSRIQMIAAALFLCALIGALILISSAWSRVWPWSAANRADRAEQAASTAQSDATARGLEVTGQATIAGRVDTYAHQTITIQTATAETIAEGRTAPDASNPVPADRFNRQRALDRVLCDNTPGLCETSPAGAPK